MGPTQAALWFGCFLATERLFHALWASTAVMFDLRGVKALVFVLGILGSAQACSIFEFADSGFAANAIHLMHAVPIFDGNNGTFFLDNSQVRN